MFYTNELQGDEIALVLGLFVLSIFVLSKQLSSRSIYSFCSPPTILSLTVLYYSVLGPVFSVWNGETFFRGIEHREHYVTSWMGGLLFFVFFLIGYSSSGNKAPSQNKYLLPAVFKAQVFKKQVFTCYVIGFGSYILLVGTSGFAQIAFWSQSSGGGEALVDAGGFAGYLLNGFNFLVIACPGIVYMYRKKQLPLYLAAGLLFVAFALFISAGFRWRLVVGAITSLSMWYIAKGEKVKLLPLVTGGFAFLVFMGVMEATRSYGKGLNFAENENKGISDYLASAFNETAVFKASGLVMSRAGNEFSYIGLTPLLQTVFTPIPRAFWPSKPTGDYLIYVREAYSSVNKNEGVGQAILNYAEYYMMAGWIGVMAMGLLVGWYYAKTNKPIISTTKRELNPWYIIFCLQNAAYIYLILSRGYLPAQFMLYFFTVYPAWYFYKQSLKKV